MQTQIFNVAQSQLMDAQSLAAKARVDSSSSALKNANKDSLREAAEDFEAVFIAQMMKPMFDTINREGGSMSGGSAEEIYQSMMVEEVGKSIAKSGGIGIADNVYRELLKLQEH
ncbi:rod-binding protein [Kordiimonas pumila]|uniref:Rod-binding protein n=1 Tax=Kordiimonas pumila TaxID=2161677 RepID=A0ABV7D253_9PROT|nr:rod-binding protein [Kordiimonas pumila]